MSPNSEYIAGRLERAPEIRPLTDFKLMFGQSADLLITEGTKVVEAHAHEGQQGQLVTLIYQGLGSFTFALKPAVPLAKASNWHVSQGLEGQ